VSKYRGSRRIGAALAALAAAAVLSVAAVPTPAQAQGLFEALFGGFDRGMRRGMPSRAYSYSDPSMHYDRRRERGYAAERHSSSAGPSSGFCVRTCDGRFFPVRSAGGMSATEQCRSFCPAASTKVFSGSKIDHSVASDGQRYADLDNAFLYRERMVKNCTCNGKDPYGLVTLKAESDPTLKAGDIIATNDGLVTYAGKKQGEANFTPVAELRGSSEWRLRLMSIKVAPAPVSEEDDAAVAPSEDNGKPARPDRRAQTQQSSVQR
jgi:hypothetical protein